MTGLPEALVGLALLYFLPGFAVARAVFPDRRIFRPLSLATLLEQMTLGLVLSVGLTVLVGAVLLVPGIGFSAGWSDPRLEIALAGIAGAGFVVAAGRGSFARHVPPSPEIEAAPEDPLPTIRRLERLHREERRLLHARRGTDPAPDLDDRLAEVRREIGRTEAAREAELARA